MSKFEINLKEVYGSLFGYIGESYPALSSLESLQKGLVDRINPVEEEQSIVGGAMRKNPEGMEGISPMDFKDIDGELVDFTFPYEPVININGKNIWKRKYPQDASGGGSIKTLWNQDDWEISLKGVFVNQYDDNKPLEDIQKLLAFNKKGLVQIQSTITDIYDIKKMAIRSIEFPEFANERVQPFIIKGWSDHDDYSLFD